MTWGGDCGRRPRHPAEATRGARINTISPGIVMTPLAKDELSGPPGEGYRRMIDGSVAERAGTPDEVGAVAALLMGPAGGFITGSGFLMDGGDVAEVRFWTKPVDSSHGHRNHRLRQYR
jgi:NAD(P)-dependent dehydrogenase (short-subunit alcohol dehydrogenase family)